MYDCRNYTCLTASGEKASRWAVSAGYNTLKAENCSLETPWRVRCGSAPKKGNGMRVGALAVPQRGNTDAVALNFDNCNLALHSVQKKKSPNFVCLKKHYSLQEVIVNCKNILVPIIYKQWTLFLSAGHAIPFHSRSKLWMRNYDCYKWYDCQT